MTRYMVVAEVTFVSGNRVVMPCELHESKAQADIQVQERQAAASMFIQEGKIYLPTGTTGGMRMAAGVGAFLGGALGIGGVRFMVAQIDDASSIVTVKSPSLILPAS